jgi:hypothetical protein
MGSITIGVINNCKLSVRPTGWFQPSIFFILEFKAYHERTRICSGYYQVRTVGCLLGSYWKKNNYLWKLKKKKVQRKGKERWRKSKKENFLFRCSNCLPCSESGQLGSNSAKVRGEGLHREIQLGCVCRVPGREFLEHWASLQYP